MVKIEMVRQSALPARLPENVSFDPMQELPNTNETELRAMLRYVLFASCPCLLLRVACSAGMRLLVQQGGKTHEFELPESAKVEHLHEQLEAVGIPKRRQKLIYKGKTLLPHHDLSQAKVCQPTY